MTTQTIERTQAGARRWYLSNRMTRWAVPSALALLALAVFLPTLSDVHTFDALSYIRDVDQRAGFFFHPHHLLYSPTGWLFWQVWRVFGYDGGSELALKVLNSLVSAACGFGLYRLTLRISGSWWAALTAAGLLLFNYGVWYFSVEVEVYILALVWLLAALALLIELVTQPRTRTAPLLGVSLGLAALYHQTNGLLVPVVIAGMLLSPLSWRERIKRLVISGSLAGAIVALGYLLVGFGYNGYRSFSQLREWMFFFVETGWWGHATRDRLTDLGAGLGNTISTEGALPFWIGILVLLVLGLPSAARTWPRIVAICGLWIAIYGGFFSWWEGENIEFWIGTLLPLWLLVGLSVARLGALATRSTAARLGQGVSLVSVVVPLLMVWHNYPIVERRGDASQDLQRQLADGIKAATAPADLIISPGGVMELYLPYYEDRHNLRTLNATLFEVGGDIPAAFERLRGEIKAGLHAGLTVIVGQEAMELQERNQRYPIDQPMLDDFWQPYRTSMQPAVVHKGTTYFWRLPNATELARGEGWRWQSFDWGWQAANIEAEQLNGGWCFNPQPDPALVSPLLNLDAGSFRAVEVTMRTSAQNQQAQLFFAGADGAMSDQRSVIWDVIGDGAVHVYTVPLAETNGWQGQIERLRLDPISVGDGSDGSRTCIESLKLVP
ncbi:MAG: glycosyltransferase family 39 protein [Chloroflexi bacterium]|nr:glycosyltransferase family 39 protein [Chloroflexota bacterium]